MGCLGQSLEKHVVRMRKIIFVVLKIRQLGCLVAICGLSYNGFLSLDPAVHMLWRVAPRISRLATLIDQRSSNFWVVAGD